MGLQVPYRPCGVKPKVLRGACSAAAASARSLMTALEVGSWPGAASVEERLADDVALDDDGVEDAR